MLRLREGRWNPMSVAVVIVGDAVVREDLAEMLGPSGFDMTVFTCASPEGFQERHDHLPRIDLVFAHLSYDDIHDRGLPDYVRAKSGRLVWLNSSVETPEPLPEDWIVVNVPFATREIRSALAGLRAAG